MNRLNLLNTLKSYKKSKIQESWQVSARKEQRLPDSDWFGWLIMAGRGWGKTRTGAESIKELIATNKYKRICLLSQTYDQVRSIMIEGESGLLNIYKNKKEAPVFRSYRKELVWPNGAIATCYSAENYEALRGPQFDLAWIDEFAKFDNIQETWDQLMFCLRLGQPKIIITTTPRNKDILLRLLNRQDIVKTFGTTFDNSNNLSDSFLKIIDQEYKDSSLGEQEIYGKLQSDESNLWNSSDFQYKKEENYDYTIIAVDPAITSNSKSNETGIVVAAKKNNIFYILDDQSAVMKTECWIEKVNSLYYQYNVDKVLIENNQGGDILTTLLEKTHNLPIQTIRAKESKYNRAKSISYLYKQKQVFHAKRFEKLEKQMLNAHVKHDDDRLDAAVWALIDLLKYKDQEKILVKTSNFDSWM